MEDARWEQRLKRERARSLELEAVIEDHARALRLAEERLREQQEAVAAQVDARIGDRYRQSNTELSEICGMDLSQYGYR